MRIEIEGISDTEITQIIVSVANKVGPKYRFGYHSIEDMAAQAVLEGIKVLEAGKFTPGKDRSPDGTKKRLRAFLSVCMNNRMRNYVRNNSCRYSSENNKYNTSKYNLMHPVRVGDATHFFGDCPRPNEVESAEVIRYIRSKLTVDQVKDFVRIQNGVSIPAGRKALLIETVKEILNETQAED